MSGSAAAKVPWGKIAAATFGIMGVGWILMKTTVPTPEEQYARLAPDLQKRVDQARALRIAQEEEMRKEVFAQLNDPNRTKPVWLEPPKTNPRS